MIIVIFIILLIVVTSLGIILYYNKDNHILNKIFLVFICLIDFWILTNLLSHTPFDKLALLGAQLGILGPAFIPPVLLIFSYIFCYGVNKYKKKRNFLYLVFIPSIIIGLFTFTDYNVKNFEITSEGNFFTPGGLYYFLILYLVVSFIFIFYLLIKAYKNSRGIVRLQAIYIIFSFIFTLVIGLIFTAILPFFDIKRTTFVGPFSTVFLLIFTSYAILRYRLMDIRVIIKRSAVFAVLVIIITSIYALFAYLISLFFQNLIGTQSIILNGVITAILVSIGFEPLKTWLSEVTDKYLFKAEYDPQEIVAEFSDKLTSSLDLTKINQFIVKRLSEVLKPTFVSTFLLNEDKKVYERAASKGQPVKTLTKIDQKLFSKIFNYFKSLDQEKEIIVREEMIKINEQLNNPILDLLIKNLEEHAVNLVVPMFLRDKLVGILFLGDKKSGDVYSRDDLRVLEIISKQAAVAIQNAQLFEEQKNFAQHLEKVVAERTKALKDANVQLKKLDKAKSEFISIASHQLRTPLTVIKGYISMISQGDYGKISDQVAEPLDRIYKSTLRIITLVEDLLNISRIESGRMKYDFSKADLAKIVNSVYEELEQHAKNKGLEFKYIKPKKELPEIVMDQKKIREVVMNLMDNAIKYTDQGSIKITLEKKNNSIVYCVKDTGRGVEQDEMPMLFKKFSRAKGAKLVHTEGTGLGLYIAKQIIEKHGGKIWAESDGRNKGSKFCIEFKIKNKKLEKELAKQKQREQKSKQKNNKK
jgi:signal transduction histidine kinase